MSTITLAERLDHLLARARSEMLELDMLEVEIAGNELFRASVQAAQMQEMVADLGRFAYNVVDEGFFDKLPYQEFPSDLLPRNSGLIIRRKREYPAFKVLGYSRNGPSRITESHYFRGLYWHDVALPVKFFLLSDRGGVWELKCDLIIKSGDPNRVLEESVPGEVSRIPDTVTLSSLELDVKHGCFNLAILESQNFTGGDVGIPLQLLDSLKHGILVIVEQRAKELKDRHNNMV